MKPYLMVMGAGIIWGTGTLLVRVLQVQGMDATSIMLLRTLFAWVILGAWIILTRPKALRLNLRDLGHITVLALVGPALSQPLFVLCVTLTSVAMAALMNYTAPMFVALLASIFLREKITPRKACALLLTIGGLLFVTGAWKVLIAEELNLSWLALASGLGSGFFYAVYTLLLKGIAPRYRPATIQFWTMTMALPVLMGYTYINLGGAPTVPASAWPAAIANSAGPGTLAFLLFTGGISSIQAGNAAIAATVEPIATACLGFFFLREGLSSLDMLGMALVLCGISLVSRPEPQKSHACISRLSR